MARGATAARTAKPAKAKKTGAGGVTRRADLRSLPGGKGAWRAQQRAEFVVELLGGVRATAEVMGVAPSQVSRWVSGASEPGPESAQLLIDIDHLLALLLQEWAPAVVPQWLRGANAYLGFARPIDLLKLRRVDEVVDAAREAASGAYA